VAGVERDQFTRPLVIPPGGGDPIPYTRTTTFIKALDGESWGLSMWGKRRVAYGMYKQPKLLDLAALASGPDDKIMDSVCEKAHEAAGGNASRDWGTQIHALTEKIDKNETPDLTNEERPDIQAYIVATKKLKTIAAELFVVNDELQVGGTLDRLIQLGDKLHVADLKTGKLHGPSMAMQIALYANSQVYNPETGERTPLGADLEVGYVIHLPMHKGKCTIHSVDIVAGWEGVKLAAQVDAYKSKKFLKALRV